MKLWLMGPLFSALGVLAGARWQPRMLAWAAILMAWSDKPTLDERFEQTRQTLTQMFPGRRRVGQSYQGFVKMLARWSPQILRRLACHLRQTMVGLLVPCWSIAGWVPFAVDGTKIALARTAALEAGFGVAGKDKAGPQALLTCLLHLGSGVLWDYRVGRADASERAHLSALLEHLPAGALLLADAGFVGYAVLSQLHERGYGFVVRVGANVRLLRGMGWAIETRHDGLVYLWPDATRRAGQPPLVLRLIQVVGAKGKTMSLLTNVLDAGRLSDEQATIFYHMRWGVEVHYRTLKQTLGKRKMLSESTVNAELELHWAMMGLWLLQLLTAKAHVEAGRSPRGMSLALAKRIVLRMLREPQRHLRRGDGLSKRLRAAVQDSYKRSSSKTARDWPHKKNQRPPGEPAVNDATPLQIEQAAPFECRRMAG